MDIYYLSNNGKKIEFNKDPVFCEEPEKLLKAKMSYSLANENSASANIQKITKSSIERPVTLGILADDEDSFKTAFNRIAGILDYDISIGKPGRIYWDEYYCDAICVQLDHDDYDPVMDAVEVSITFLCPDGSWKEETTIDVQPVEDSSETLTYPYTYSYNYGEDKNGDGTITNPSETASDFILVIYEATDPVITIAGHLYKLLQSVPSGYHVVVNSAKKTVRLMDSGNNEVANWINNRYKTESIFEKIPAGTSEMQCDGSFHWIMTMMDSRSVPKISEV